MPKPLLSPVTVPTRESCGLSGFGGLAGGDGNMSTVVLATGRRRKGEKIGRSRVAVRSLSGIAQSGLPVPALPQAVPNIMAATNKAPRTTDTVILNPATGRKPTKEFAGAHPRWSKTGLAPESPADR